LKNTPVGQLVPDGLIPALEARVEGLVVAKRDVANGNIEAGVGQDGLLKRLVPDTIIERQPRVGGRTSLIESGGYCFDLGPTFFLYPQILQEILREVGRDLFKEVPMTKLDPQYRISFGAGGELNATPDLGQRLSGSRPPTRKASGVS
jgi:hypothetical protein